MTIIYKFLNTNVDSDCDDENVIVKSVCKDKSVKVLWYSRCKDISVKDLWYNFVRTYQ
jgi:hypothetical protein